MRNLKKILALVLALVMSLSLMATAGAGSFQDVTDDNPYKTAIDVLDELKVFQGFEDGSFKPTDTLNRAQAAVLVYRIATGDVENKYLDNYTYMAQSKFNDLEGYNWAKGYINYCQNAGIVVGTSATTFDPGAKVTGYQLMVMLLRTLGYGKAGEFTDPKGWELQTAAIAEREGILKNVTGGDFGAPAPRQMVAEILFRGLLHDTVQYSALTPGGYTLSGETLGKKNLGLEDIKGVVMANEWADLEDDDTLAEGKTRLDVDGKTYNLDVSSELTDIGELRHAYVQNGTKVLTSLEDTGDNNVKDSKDLDRRGEGIKVEKLRGEVKLNGDTEYFVNFDPSLKDQSDWRIEYIITDKTLSYADAHKLVADNKGVAWVDTNDNGKVDAGEYQIGTKNGNTENKDSLTIPDDYFTYSKVIAVRETITATDFKYIRAIFDSDGQTADSVIDADDVYDGEVYAGTSSKPGTDDKSNTMSYWEFYEKYIDPDTNKSISESDNGEWLKVVDNNGDGVAEYVFLTTFCMSTVTDWNAKTETWTFETNPYDATAKVKAGDINLVDGAELALNDVILFTKIDGVYHVSEPAPVKMTVANKGIDYKAKTLTGTDETVYDWSEIDYKADNYYDDVSYAVQGVSYNLYQDHFGFTRLYKEADGGLVLLTDGYFETDRRDDVYKAQIWNGEFADVTVLNPVSARANLFISNRVQEGTSNETIGNRLNDDEGTWGRLFRFGSTYYVPARYNYGLADHNSGSHNDLPAATNYIYRTNIASYVVDGDGAYTLSPAVDHRENALTHYNSFAIDVTNYEVKAKDQVLWGIETVNAAGAIATTQRINTTTETVYYLVEGSGKNLKVTTWTGYNNAPSNYTVTSAYAVTSYVVKDKTPYEVAEVVVIEDVADNSVPNAYLGVSLEQRLFGNMQIGLNGLGYHPDTEKWGIDTEIMKVSKEQTKALQEGNDDKWPNETLDMMNFYYVDANGNAVRITKDFTYYRIYAGKVVTSDYVENRNYVQITKDGTTNATQKNSFFFPRNDSETYTVSYTTAADNYMRTNYDVAYTNTFDLGDKVIYMVDADGNVGFVVNVTDSKWTNANGDEVTVPGLTDLYDVIEKDYEENKYYSITVNGGSSNVTSFLKTEETVAINLKDSTGAAVTVKPTVTNATIEDVNGSGKWLLTKIKGDVTINIGAAAGVTGAITNKTQAQLVDLFGFAIGSNLTSTDVKVKHTVGSAYANMDISTNAGGTQISIAQLLTALTTSKGEEIKFVSAVSTTNATMTSSELIAGVGKIVVTIGVDTDPVTITVTHNDGSNHDALKTVTINDADKVLTVLDANGKEVKDGMNVANSAVLTVVQPLPTGYTVKYSVSGGAADAAIPANGQITASGNVTITAVKTTAVTYAVDFTVGEVTVKTASGTTVNKGDKFAAGTKLTVTLAEDRKSARASGYVADTTDGGRTGILTMPAADVTITTSERVKVQLTYDPSQVTVTEMDGTTVVSTPSTVWEGAQYKVTLKNGFKFSSPAVTGTNAAIANGVLTVGSDATKVKTEAISDANQATALETKAVNAIKGLELAPINFTDDDGTLDDAYVKAQIEKQFEDALKAAGFTVTNSGTPGVHVATTGTAATVPDAADKTAQVKGVTVTLTATVGTQTSTPGTEVFSATDEVTVNWLNTDLAAGKAEVEQVVNAHATNGYLNGKKSEGYGAFERNFAFIVNERTAATFISLTTAPDISVGNAFAPQSNVVVTYTYDYNGTTCTGTVTIDILDA